MYVSFVIIAKDVFADLLADKKAADEPTAHIQLLEPTNAITERCKRLIWFWYTCIQYPYLHEIIPFLAAQSPYKAKATMVAQLFDKKFVNEIRENISNQIIYQWTIQSYSLQGFV